jgi:hypothetical protein
MAVYKNSIPFGSIVTDGLILNLDATNINSYPGSGTTWTDTSGYNNSGTLTNGPTFLRERGRGSIVFDGVDDYTALPVGSIVDAITMLFWISGSYQNYKLSLFERATVTGTGLSTGIPNNGWVQLGYSAMSGSTGQFIINGTVYNADSNASFPYDNATYKPLMWMGSFNYFGSNSSPNLSLHLQPSAGLYTGFKWGHNFPYKAIGVSATGGNRRYFTGGISNTQIYNKALSAQEVQQNYNALKSRFGL